MLLAELGLYPVEVYALLETVNFAKRLHEMGDTSLAGNLYKLARQETGEKSLYKQLQGWLKRWGLNSDPLLVTEEHVYQAYIIMTWTRGPLTENKYFYREQVRDGLINVYTYGLQPYLQQQLPKKLTSVLVRCRTRTTLTPYISQRWKKVPREARKCLRCPLDVLDNEDHFFQECPFTFPCQDRASTLNHGTFRMIMQQNPRAVAKFVLDCYDTTGVHWEGMPAKPRRQKPKSRKRKLADRLLHQNVTRKRRCLSNHRGAVQPVPPQMPQANV